MESSISFEEPFWYAPIFIISSLSLYTDHNFLALIEIFNELASNKSFINLLIENLMSIAGYIELSDNSLDKTKCPSNDALHKSTIGSF